jgi:small subunit ribosomal protein S18
MARPRTNRRKTEREDRKPKRKVSILDQESVTYVDYKDVNLLRRFMSERAKIRARRVTGNDAQQQREVARAIRVAREMALLPYSVRQVTHRSKGKRGDRDRGDREGPLRMPSDDAPMPSPDAPPPTSGDVPAGETEALDARAPDAGTPDTDAPDAGVEATAEVGATEERDES